MDEVYPVAPSSSNTVVDHEYNIPRNIVNPDMVREYREEQEQRLQEAHKPSPTHRPLLLPSSSKTKVPPITISLSPPTEETNGELVHRELFRASKEVIETKSRLSGSALIACLIAVAVVLSIIFLVLLFHNM